MGCDDLIKAIGEQACRLRDDILARADEEARAIVREAEAQCAGRLENARVQGAAAARGEASGIVSTARLKAKREVLAARHENIEAVLRALETRLGLLLGTPAYRKILKVLLAENSAASPDLVTVRCRREDRSLVEDWARRQGRQISIEETALPFGGVETAAGPEGRLICRNTLADRMERVRPLLLQEAGRLLYGPQRNA